MLRRLGKTAAPAAAAGTADASVADSGDEEGEDEDEGGWSTVEDELQAAAAPRGGGGDARAFADAWTGQAARRGLVGALVALAYPDRIAQRRDAGAGGGRAAFVLSSGRPVRLLQPDDPLKDAPYIAVAELSGGRDGRNDAATLAAALSLGAIRTHLAAEIREEEVVFWAPASKVVLARRQSRLGSLVLSEAPAEVADERALPVLFKALQDGGWASLPIPPAAEAWRHRAAWLRAAEAAAAGGSALPDLSEAALLAALPAWLGPYAPGVRGRAQLAKLDWGGILRGLMTWEQQRRVEEEAPSHVELPTGSRVAIEYGPRAQPTARARLQECFGLRDTPRLGGPARVPLLLELLSPASRPLQVTSDLASFWANSYTDVRKDMAGRYPKHAWPLDPLNAEATRLTKKAAAAAAAAQEKQPPAAGGGGSGGGAGSGGGKKKRR
ncbi:MAG: ATP-dependent helicase C-terminal-domain-containing protein [Monoraphidium minutum]|nr:MAG: ATP-dependent helicase C-terminal-domain-containing protein [Monoraphidium minutum]